MKALRRIYYRLIPTYRRLELKALFYDEADKLLKSEEGRQWTLAQEEDTNYSYGTVWLERKERITE